MNKKYRLKHDVGDYAKGSVFIATHEDEGMWSKAFVNGTMVDADGRSEYFSCEPRDVEYIENGDDAPVLGIRTMPYFEPSQELIDHYMNPLNHP